MDMLSRNSPTPRSLPSYSSSSYITSHFLSACSQLHTNNITNVSFSSGTLVPITMRSNSTNQNKKTPLPLSVSATAAANAVQSLVPTLEEEEEQKLKNRKDYEGPPDQVKKKRACLCEVWREVQGSNNWEGMLDPMDNLLRSELIKYGEFAQACYDAFDFDPYSTHCGNCKYNKRTLFEDLGLPHRGYSVTEYLYATSNINLPNFFKKSPITDRLWSDHANWMGFVAVADDEQEIKKLGRRDIVIAWRGTVTALEWMDDLMDFLKPAGFNPDHPDPRIKVESGFLNLYTSSQKECRFTKSSAHEQIRSEIKRLVEKYKGEELSITITGHSLGSALAILSAYDIAEMGLTKNIPITVFSFAGPRVGNSAFKNRLEDLGIKILRVVNTHDAVPKVPGILLNERLNLLREWVDKLPWSYTHVGVELELDHSKSPFLKPTHDPSAFHNLEAHLHLLDGYHGREERFYLANRRDPALVNKSSDLLRDHLQIPPCWRQDHNKGMVRNSEGRWVRPPLSLG